MCEQLESLKSTILSCEENVKVAIVMHPNPDPDCFGSAVGLQKLILHWKPTANVKFYYTGDISHPQNKTLVNVLNLTLINIEDVDDFETSANIYICVDGTPERNLNGRCEKIQCLLVLDHHKSKTEACKLQDIRPVGATASIVWEYLMKEGINLNKSDDSDTVMATAIAVGIKTDTNDLVSENVTDLDWSAYKGAMDFVSRRYLQSINNYPVPAYHFELRSRLDDEDNIHVEGGVFVGGLGYISPAKRDVLAVMATERSRMEGVDTAFVFAIVGDFIEVCVRSNGLSVDVNGLCQKIFGKEYAGGKMGSGAAKIPMSFLAVSDSPEDIKIKMWDSVRGFIITKIFGIIQGG